MHESETEEEYMYKQQLGKDWKPNMLLDDGGD